MSQKGSVIVLDCNSKNVKKAFSCNEEFFLDNFIYFNF